MPIALLFWKPMTNSWQSIWVEKWGILFYFVCLYWVFSLRIRGIFLIWAGYFLTIGCLSAFIGGYHSLLKDEKFLAPSLRSNSLRQLLMFSAFLLFMEKRPFYFKRYLPVTGAIVMILLCFSQDSSLFVPGMQNPSMAATFVVLSGCPFSFLSVLLAKSWTAAMCWCALTFYKIERKFRCLFVSGCFLTAAIVLFIRGLGDHGNGYIGNGRLEIWKTYLPFWWHSGWRKVWFGFGPGTTATWLPYAMAQKALSMSAKDMDAYIQAHNDWIQITTDQGLVGIVLSLVCVLSLWRIQEKRRGLLLAFSIAMMSNFPLHWPLTALVGWLLTDGVFDEHRNFTGGQFGVLNVNRATRGC